MFDGNDLLTRYHKHH